MKEGEAVSQKTCIAHDHRQQGSDDQREGVGLRWAKRVKCEHL